MLMGEILLVAFDAIIANKLRSLLTMLGIVIGIAAVTTMVALGEGAQRSVESQLRTLGANVLTVRPGDPASHRGSGWERITDHAIRTLVDRGGPLVAILWGRDAQSLRPLLADVPRIESVHPSPLSASRGFFGSRPFSRANALLVEQGGEPVDWAIPD